MTSEASGVYYENHQSFCYRLRSGAGSAAECSNPRVLQRHWFDSPCLAAQYQIGESVCACVRECVRAFVLWHPLQCRNLPSVPRCTHWMRMIKDQDSLFSGSSGLSKLPSLSRQFGFCHRDTRPWRSCAAACGGLDLCAVVTTAGPHKNAGRQLVRMDMTQRMQKKRDAVGRLGAVPARMGIYLATPRYPYPGIEEPSTALMHECVVAIHCSCARRTDMQNPYTSQRRPLFRFCLIFSYVRAQPQHRRQAMCWT